MMREDYVVWAYVAALRPRGDVAQQAAGDIPGGE
jgi:hypothetical protein